MILSLDDLVVRHRLSITGVVHVGAHEGREAETYDRNGIAEVTWVEANPQVIPRLRSHVEPFGQRVVSALVTDRPGPTNFNITNNEKSSSILELGTHKQEHPDVTVARSIVLQARTLDEVVASEKLTGFNLLVMDIQGAELHVLRAAPHVLRQVDYLYLEVNERPLYVGCGLVSDLDDYLSDFSRIDTAMTEHGWGDAFYIRKSILAKQAT